MKSISFIINHNFGMSELQSLPNNHRLFKVMSWGQCLSAPDSVATVEARIAEDLSALFGLEDYVVLAAPAATQTYEVVLSHPSSVYRLSLQTFSLTDTTFMARVTPQAPELETIDRCGLDADGVQRWKQAGITEIAGIMVPVGYAYTATLWLPIKRHTVVAHLNTPWFHAVCAQLGNIAALLIARNIIAQQQADVQHSKLQLDRMQAYLQGDIDSQPMATNIVGTGVAMQKVLQRVAQVSYTNSTVFILGETGTGKELIARAIHSQSPRHDKPMIKVNCAALPASLIESELFGHEKGSFTGATERRIGKFELADKGTLFLDEIGEMPPALQAKLLRALQEREIERVGGQASIKIDVRIIAATNRVLENEVQAGRFRQDLYYRLHVFPIQVPPLREHKEDIPALVSHFVTRFSQQNGKNVTQVSRKALHALVAYDWPGNIRQLEHVIERGVLMASGSTLSKVSVPKKDRNVAGISGASKRLKTFVDNERDYILQALKACEGKIYGPGGAAALLGLKVSTLNSKILKLGIQKGKLFTRHDNKS